MTSALAEVLEKLERAIALFDSRVLDSDGRLVFAERCKYEEAMRASFDLVKDHGASLLRDAGDARDDEWVLVPRRITGPATDLLANFDMDDVGNNRGDAAEECWAALVEQLSRPAPELKFSNPVFHAGTNLTVRRGTKWHREQWATVQIGDTRLTVRLSCMTHRFAWLTDHWVRDEHDPACRTVAGLLAEMQRVYPGFSEQEEVTLVRFNVPAIDAAMHAPGGAGGGGG